MVEDVRLERVEGRRQGEDELAAAREVRGVRLKVERKVGLRPRPQLQQIEPREVAVVGHLRLAAAQFVELGVAEQSMHLVVPERFGAAGAEISGHQRDDRRVMRKRQVLQQPAALRDTQRIRVGSYRVAIAGNRCEHPSMTALRQPNSLSVAEYLAGEEQSEVKHEYLGGAVHAMAGASNQHNTIAVNAVGFLLARLRGRSCQPFNGDTKVRIEFPDHIRFYYPDAMVVCEPNPPADHFQDRPVVIVEVLSESTRRTDLGEKRDAYLTIPTLKVLLFVEPESPCVLVFRRQPEGGFAVAEVKGIEATIPLPEIEAKLPLAELYERIRF